MEPVASQFQALTGTGPWHRDARGGHGCRQLPVGASWSAQPTNSPEEMPGKHVLDCTPRGWIPSFIRFHVGERRGLCPMIGTCPGSQQCARMATAPRARLVKSCRFGLCADVSAPVPPRTPRRLEIWPPRSRRRAPKSGRGGDLACRRLAAGRTGVPSPACRWSPAGGTSEPAPQDY